MRPLHRMSAPAITGCFLLACSGGAAAQGTEFNLSCNSDEVLVGIGGRQSWWLEGIAARCRAVGEDGTLGASIRSTAYTGGTGGDFSTFDCKPAEVMVGFTGSQGDNGYVLHVHELVCAPWDAGTRTSRTAFTRTVTAFDRKPGSEQSINDSCLGGRVGTRLRGRAGRYLDRLIDIGCSYVAGASLPNGPKARLGPDASISLAANANGSTEDTP